jgi:hypothetical protein
MAVREQTKEVPCVLPTRDNDDFANVRVDQSLHGIENHGSIVDRQQMLVGDTRERVKSRTLTPREDDTFHMLSSPWSNSLIWVAHAPIPEFPHAQNHRISLGISNVTLQYPLLFVQKMDRSTLGLSLPVQLHATA